MTLSEIVILRLEFRRLSLVSSLYFGEYFSITKIKTHEKMWFEIDDTSCVMAYFSEVNAWQIRLDTVIYAMISFFHSRAAPTQSMLVIAIVSSNRVPQDCEGKKKRAVPTDVACIVCLFRFELFRV